MDCPKCNKKMIKTGTEITLTSYPPIYPQIWWCGCGHSQGADSIRGKTTEDIRQEEWENLNK